MSTLFLIILESSEMHFDLVASKIGVKLNFSSKNLKAQKLEIKILVNETI